MRRRCLALALPGVLALSAMPVAAGPALSASFLSSGLSEALNDLGPFLDGIAPATSISASHQFNSTVSFPDRLWSVSVSGAFNGAETGALVLSGKDISSGGDNGLRLAAITQSGASESHGPRAITLTVTTPRQLAGQQNEAEVVVMTVTLGAAQLDSALEVGTYAAASADANAGVPLLDVYLGTGRCHSATRSFVVDELSYVSGQLAKLTAHFRCGARFAGVVRYDDLALSATPTVAIAGQVWEDENADGMKSSVGDGLNRPDAVRSNVTVNLFSSGVRVAQTITDNIGRFEFGVPVGSYQIGIETPPGMHLTLRDVGGDENRDSDFDPVTGRSEVFDTAAGAPPFVTIGLSYPGGHPKLPLLSTTLQPLQAGDRISYRESRRGESLLATDTVQPGITVMDGSVAKRVGDSVGNLQFVSNDARGLRLHRAVMLLPDPINVPPIRRHAVIDFSPPLVLLPGNVTLGNFSSTGVASLRSLERDPNSTPTVQLRYAVSAEVSTGFSAGLDAGMLAQIDSAQGRLATVSISRRFRFTGLIDNSSVSRLTDSQETYAANVGLISSYTPNTPRDSSFTHVRRGLGTDLNGDRRADLLTLENTAPSAEGTQTLRSWHPRPGVTSSNELGQALVQTRLAGDFDADGVSELLSYDPESGLVALLVPGDDSAQLRPVGFAATGMQLLASGDFHHDGHRTLLWRDSAGRLTQWRLDGTPLPGAFQVTDAAHAPLRVPPAWTLTGVGDFDANGADDLLWRETAGSRTVAWLMDGAVRVAKLNLPAATAQRRMLAVDDFDGEGHSDLLWFNPSGRQLELWLLQDNGGVVRTLLGQSPSGAKLLASGDYDGNGNADLVWRTGEQLTLWQLRKGLLYRSGNAGNLAPTNLPLR